MPVIHESRTDSRDDLKSLEGERRGSVHSIQFGEEDHVRISTQLFNLIDTEDKGAILSGQFIDMIEESGLKRHDIRLEEVFERLDTMGGLRKDIELSLEKFIEVIRGNSVLISKAMQGQLIVPNFPDFCEELTSLFRECAINEKGGKVATYIPVLATQDPSLWSAAVVTIDGQEFAIGDHDYKFCVQSCCKPISYLMAAQENGFDFVHHHVGREPSGESFNKLHLKDFPSEDNPNRKVPHNPMINAGAIMSCALIQRNKPMSDRFAFVMQVWDKLCGDNVGFSNSVYLSEKDTADRNFCLGYMMQEYDSFPKGTNLKNTLEFYFQQCSIEANTRQMALMAATLANGGTNPQTGTRIFDAFHVRNCLSLMLSSGMYDYSGEWGFNIGLPAKSGVAGCVWVVVPNKMGIATFSPRLDSCGNSSRGVAFYQELVKIYNFHQFDNLRGVISSKHKKKDPTKRSSETVDVEVTQILFAAAHGDLNELVRLQAQGADMFLSDYDFRSGLHLAASEGHLHVIKLYVMLAQRSFSREERIEKLSPRDRWGRTPLDDATSGGHDRCKEFLESHSAQTGAGTDQNGMQFAGKIPNISNLTNFENIGNVFYFLELTSFLEQT